MARGWTALACVTASIVWGCGPGASVEVLDATGSGSDVGATGVEPVCPVGSETCPCTEGGGCDPGLTCLSSVCVVLPDTTTGANGTDPDPATSAGSTTGGSNAGTSTSGSTSSSEGGTGPVYSALGPQTNVAIDDVVGWDVCWSGPYRAEEPAVGDVLDVCDGDELMLACRHANDDFYSVLAHAPREDVTMEQSWPVTPHVANGSGWYLVAPNGIGDEGAWGFVSAGDEFTGSGCDQESDLNADLRLCWILRETYLFNGFRCGANLPLNESFLWKRVVLHR